MKILTYKGYIGEYEQYNDGVDATPYYAGSIPSVKHKAVVLFEGETLSELTEDFHAAVEDCIANGYKPRTKSHRVTIPENLYSLIKVRASQNGQSLSKYVNNVLATALL